MPERRLWAYWEDWKFGWQVIDGRLHFENEDIESLIPMHLPVEKNPLVPEGMVPVGPPFNPNSEAANWVLRFPFENGWEAMVCAEYGVALNAAGFVAINRRVVGPGTWLHHTQYEDPGLAFPVEGEEPHCTRIDGDEDHWCGELCDTYPYLGMLVGPDHLQFGLTIASTLPSDPEVRRALRRRSLA